MRIHGVQQQGLAALAGAAPITLDAGYNAVASLDAEECAARAALVLALLFPERALAHASTWCDRASTAPARAALSLGAGGKRYRVIVDFARARVGLAKLERDGAQERVSTEAAGVTGALRDLGLPAWSDYLALAWIGGEVPEPGNVADTTQGRTAPTGIIDTTLIETLGGSFVRGPDTPAAPPDPERDAELARLDASLAEAEMVAQRRRELLARRDRLEQARATLVAEERELKACLADLEQLAPLAEGIDEFDERIRRYRALVQARDAEREALDRARHELLEERARLRVVPPAQRSWIALGLLLGICGAASGVVVHPSFAALGLAGAALATAALWISRSARRRVGGIEARLAALRVRERAIERHFEAEGTSVRALLRALELENAETLENAVAKYRERGVRAETLRRSLETARRAFPDGTEAELAELEARLEELLEADADALRAKRAALVAQSAPAPAPVPPVSAPAPVAPPVAAPAAESTSDEPPTERGLDRSVRSRDLDQAVAAASRWLGKSLGEIEAAVAPTFPVYLRSLTRGALVSAERRPSTWLVRADPRAELRPFDSVAPALRLRALLALRLALLERLAPARPIPVLAMTSGLDLDEDGAAALGRALRRLAAVTQIVHFT